MPLTCRDLPKGNNLELERGAHREHHHQPTTIPRHVSADRLNREYSQLAASLEVESGPTPAGPYIHTPKPDFGGRGHVNFSPAFQHGLLKLDSPDKVLLRVAKNGTAIINIRNKTLCPPSSILCGGYASIFYNRLRFTNTRTRSQTLSYWYDVVEL